MPTDYYELLGVPKDAQPTDIKKAFRVIARECHPDVAGDDEKAVERFKLCRNAYDTLMDPVARARYDRRNERTSRGGGFGRGGGSFFDAFYRATGKDSAADDSRTQVHSRHVRKKPDTRNNLGLDDLFNDDFGFGSKAPRPTSSRTTASPPPPSRPTPPPPTPGNDVLLELDVPADIAARGGSVTAVYYRKQRVDGWSPGQGSDGLCSQQDVADIRIVPGTRDGLVLREKALGDAGTHGGRYGDLLARVRIVAPTRQGGNPEAPPGRGAAPSARPPLTTPPLDPTPPPSPAPSPSPSVTPLSTDGEQSQTLEISVVEALLGGRVTLDTPQGRVRLTIPPCTSGGARMRLKGKGTGGADLYVEMRIRVPKALDEESRTLIEAFARLNPE